MSTSLLLPNAIHPTLQLRNLSFTATSPKSQPNLQLRYSPPPLNPSRQRLRRTRIWVLVYTAFSELLPFLAIGTVPFLKVEKIRQDIDIPNQTIVNSITVSNPFASFSFSASASFEVRNPTRIQVLRVLSMQMVEFKEGTLKLPEITPKIGLPENLDIFGQSFDLSPLQQSVNPIQDVVATISRAISGQPPPKVSIPGNRSQS